MVLVDAVYCTVAGIIALVLCVPLARLFQTSWAVVAALGAVVVVWAWLLLRLARRRDLRQPVAFVGAANSAGALGFAVLAALVPPGVARLLLVAVAAEVAAFAAVQYRIWRRAETGR